MAAAVCQRWWLAKERERESIRTGGRSEGRPLSEATREQWERGERKEEGRRRGRSEGEMAPHAAVFQASFHAVAFYQHQPHRNRHQQCPQPCGNPCIRLHVQGSGLPRRKNNHRVLVSAAAAAPSPFDMVDADERATLERCFQAAPPSSSVSSLPTMKGNFGAFGAVTLEKSKLDLSQKTTRTSPETSIGGGGGDIGKRNSHGGGDGGDDGGDDDDYFGDFDDFDEGDDGGLFRRRLILQELFDRKFVDAVLQEWYKTMVNLPAGLFQAYELGLVSSAQMVRFLSINARPTVTRFISRALPESLSREFIGRMIADPSFLYKLCLEQVASVGYSVWWELKTRKGRIKEEWDLALINVLTVSACNAVLVWSLAPCHSYANTFQFEWQNFLNKLPNNIFEKNYLLREFDLSKRVQSFFYKAAGLSLIGLASGMGQGAFSNYSAGKKEGRLSVTVPSVNTNALGYGAFLGLYANLRYQLLNGLDRAVFYRFDVLGVALFFSTALRLLNVQVGESSRRAWLGIEADPLTQSDNLLKAYNRPSNEEPSSNWFISKNAIVSGLGLLGIGQKNGAEEAPKARRKRVVRKKLSPAST